MTLDKLPEKIADILYPKRCPVCHDIVREDKGRICAGCIKDLKYVLDPYCLKCGRPVKEDEEYCSDCKKAGHLFERGRAVYIYDDVIKNSIYYFKYKGRREYAIFYGKEMADQMKRFLLDITPDALIPVPIHKRRYAKRGYNQAQLLAAELSKHTGIPVLDNIIIRVSDTKAQKDLDASERQNNLKKAFKMLENDVSLNTVVIIDDIYTTGSTIDAVAGCLQKKGVCRVYYVVLSIGSL
ncbi:MAG: ComF family protein [Lachnospiraceae bacterium]|nr:ComF family protein [Lachnospiraceae bacterium]